MLRRITGDKITKETSISAAIAAAPRARGIFHAYGIAFIGKELSPLESIEKVAKGNGLEDGEIDSMVGEVNKSMKEDLDAKDAIKLTEGSASELRKLLAGKKGKNAFRLRLASGGCSMYTYDLDFASSKAGDETEIVSEGIRFYVAKKHIGMIRGLTIEYDPKSNGFVFSNPNVKE